MTTLLLSEGDPTWIIPGGGAPVTLFGSTGVDSIAISAGADVTLDGSFNAGTDNIYIEGNSSDFTVVSAGAMVTLQGADGTSIVIPSGTSGQTLVFGDGSAELVIDTDLGQVVLGDQPVTGTATALTTAVDDSQTSGDTFEGSTGSGGDTGSYTAVSIDQGTANTSVDLDAGADEFRFTDNASIQGNVVISNFTSDDVIEITGATSDDYNFSNDGTDVNITYNNSGTVNIITLLGVVDSTELIYNESSLEVSIGFDAVTYA